MVPLLANHETFCGELHGLSAFVLEDDVGYHTYSCYDRGTEVIHAAPFAGDGRLELATPSLSSLGRTEQPCAAKAFWATIWATRTEIAHGATCEYDSLIWLHCDSFNWPHLLA